MTTVGLNADAVCLLSVNQCLKKIFMSKSKKYFFKKAEQALEEGIRELQEEHDSDGSIFLKL